jgi:small subunit ribosomal protein S7
MSRKGPQKKALPAGDPVFESVMIQRFINKMMYDGKKSVAERIFYQALTSVEEKSGRNPLDVFATAMRNAMPAVEVPLAPRRRLDVPGAQRSAPRAQDCSGHPLDAGQRTQARREDDGRPLGGEFMDAARGAGGAVKKKEDTHRMAEANKAFAHFRW